MRSVYAFILAICAAGPAFAADWPHYGGDLGGQRYSSSSQITPGNIGSLIQAWEYKTGDLARRPAKIMKRTKLQGTPVLHGENLLLCTPFNEIIALDPGTGAEKWRFDPEVPLEMRPGNLFGCRGVAAWDDLSAATDTVCKSRVYTATNDGRVISVDAKTGNPCADFGTNGQVSAGPDRPELWKGEYQITSAPLIVNDTIVVGSAIADNQRADAPRGTVKAFDARTGALKWSFDPIPQSEGAATAQGWPNGWSSTGHANVWAPMSGDAARGLAFLPTSSPSPDFFGGARPGDNRYANSVVALRVETGHVAWAYQIVHHDVWDYDTPAQPTLATLDVAGAKRDVVIQGTKQGFLFVLDRDTGVPIYPVAEKPVPQGGVAGEMLSPTQPVPSHFDVLVPQTIKPDDAFGLTPWDRAVCRDAISNARNEGLYTPPSLTGTLMFPFTGGGINWGGVSVDEVTQTLFVNTSRTIHKITLVPRAEYEKRRAAKGPTEEFAPQFGTPYGMIRETVLGPVGLPCNPPPWGVIAAVDLKTGKKKWETTHGTTEELAPLGITFNWGTPTLGGPVGTRGGVVFLAAALDKYLRAYDSATGAYLWAGRLPAPGIATPTIYEWQGRQFVVIAAGGSQMGPSAIGDSFVAFALPGPGQSGPSLWARTIDQPGGRFWATAILAFFFLSSVVIWWRWAKFRLW